MPIGTVLWLTLEIFYRCRFFCSASGGGVGNAKADQARAVRRQQEAGQQPVQHQDRPARLHTVQG